MIRNSYNKTPEALAEQLASDATFTDGVYRWKSNGNVPPLDLLEIAGVPADVLATCRAAYDKETRAALDAYREARRNGPSAEELYEMRAAFGPGETVVDVITGERIQL
jgi:hypothetical protein